MAFITVTQNQPTLVSTKPIGPLSSLYQNRYQSDIHIYPRDLGTSYRGHYVQFKFVKVQPASLSDLGNKIKTSYETIKSNVTNAYNTSSGAVDTAINVGGALVSGITNSTTVQNAKYGTTTGITGITINPPQDLPGDTVLLYMPETLDFRYDSSYNNLSLADAAGSLPIVGEMIRSSRNKGIEEFNRAAYKRAVSPIGGDVPEITGREGVKAVQEQ